MPLSDVQIRRIKPGARTARYSDGGNLLLEVKPGGSKLWKLAYRFGGKQKTLSFGPYPETSLARAREKRLEAKALLRDGIDPMAKARSDKAEKRALAENTFAVIAEEMFAKVEREGRADSTLAKKRWLIEMACADFGGRPIKAISTTEVLKCLRKVESAGNYETTRRLAACERSGSLSSFERIMCLSRNEDVTLSKLLRPPSRSFVICL